MTILCLPWGKLTFFEANILIRLRTTSIPRSSEAFNSKTASAINLGPSNSFARHNILVVFPVPGGPYNSNEQLKFHSGLITERSRLGMFPVFPMTSRRPTISSFPTTSFSSCGRYFSILLKNLNELKILEFTMEVRH